MQKFALLISYVGTSYCGWQKQSGSAASGLISIQKTLEEVIQSITQEKVSTVASGRTDAGVHAAGQVVHFALKRKEWRDDLLMKALNARLPIDIRVTGALRVAESFHAQRSATQKQYSYYFQQGRVAYPHLMPYSLWIRKKLDLIAMNEALKPLIGTHDFKVFQATDASTKISTTKTIFEAEVTEIPIGLPMAFDLSQASLVRFRVIGSGFLKQMVRSMSGTLLEIGEGKRSATDLMDCVKQKRRELLGRTVLSKGLWLEQVWYEDLRF